MYPWNMLAPPSSVPQVPMSFAVPPQPLHFPQPIHFHAPPQSHDASIHAMRYKYNTEQFREASIHDSYRIQALKLENDQFRWKMNQEDKYYQFSKQKQQEILNDELNYYKRKELERLKNKQAPIKKEEKYPVSSFIDNPQSDPSNNRQFQDCDSNNTESINHSNERSINHSNDRSINHRNERRFNPSNKRRFNHSNNYNRKIDNQQSVVEESGFNRNNDNSVDEEIHINSKVDCHPTEAWMKDIQSNYLCINKTQSNIQHGLKDMEQRMQSMEVSVNSWDQSLDQKIEDKVSSSQKILHEMFANGITTLTDSVNSKIDVKFTEMQKSQKKMHKS